MPDKKVAQRKRFGLQVLGTLQKLKSQAQSISGDVVQVLHEMEGKMLRATGVIHRKRKRKTEKNPRKKTV